MACWSSSNVTVATILIAFERNIRSASALLRRFDPFVAQYNRERPHQAWQNLSPLFSAGPGRP
jgi:hypothetical protein